MVGVSRMMKPCLVTLIAANVVLQPEVKKPAAKKQASAEDGDEEDDDDDDEEDDGEVSLFNLCWSSQSATSTRSDFLSRLNIKLREKVQSAF